MKKYSSITRVSSRHTSPSRRRAFILVIIGTMAFGLFFPKIISWVSFVALYPIQAVSTWYQYSESALPNYLRARTTLVEEIESLKRQIANDTGTQLSVERLLHENSQIRTAANFGLAETRVMARVTAQPSRLAYDLLQIDKGSTDGVKLNAPVFLGKDTVIGVIAHVTPRYAFVELVTTPGFNATAYVVGPNIFAAFEGVGGGVARVKVPQGISLKEGNLVLLPGVDSGVYGEIIAIENPPTQPVQYGYVTPPLPLQGILYVSVSLDVPSARTSEEIKLSVQEETKRYFTLDETFSLTELSTSTVSTSTAETSR